MKVKDVIDNITKVPETEEEIEKLAKAILKAFTLQENG